MYIAIIIILYRRRRLSALYKFILEKAQQLFEV